MKVTKVKQKDLGMKIEGIRAQDELSLMQLQRTFGIDFGAAGYVVDGALGQGLIADFSNDEHFQYKFKILDTNGLKTYLRETLAKPIPQSQFQN